MGRGIHLDLSAEGCFETADGVVEISISVVSSERKEVFAYWQVTLLLWSLLLLSMLLRLRSVATRVLIWARCSIVIFKGVYATCGRRPLLLLLPNDPWLWWLRGAISARQRSFMTLFGFEEEGHAISVRYVTD